MAIKQFSGIKSSNWWLNAVLCLHPGHNSSSSTFSIILRRDSDNVRPRSGILQNGGTRQVVLTVDGCSSDLRDVTEKSWRSFRSWFDVSFSPFGPSLNLWIWPVVRLACRSTRELMLAPIDRFFARHERREVYSRITRLDSLSMTALLVVFTKSKQSASDSATLGILRFLLTPSFRAARLRLP